MLFVIYYILYIYGAPPMPRFFEFWCSRGTQSGAGGAFLKDLRVLRGPKMWVRSVWRELVRPPARQVAQGEGPEAPKGAKVEALGR